MRSLGAPKVNQVDCRMRSVVGASDTGIGIVNHKSSAGRLGGSFVGCAVGAMMGRQLPGR